MALYLTALVNQSKVIEFIKSNFFAPRTRDLTPQESAFLQRGKPFSLHVDGKTVQAWRYGSGPAIICAHGWASRGARFVNLESSIINAGFSMVIFDAPGHGESEGKTSSFFQMTEAVRALINHLGADKIAGIFAHSFGAAAVINAMDKEKLSKPVVLEAPAWDIKYLLDETFRRYGIPMKLYDNILSGYERKYGYELAIDNPINLVRRVDSPVLILHDRGDRTIKIDQSDRVLKLKKSNIRLITTDNYGHSHIFTNAEYINQAMDFIIQAGS